jgi:hypothetical protein
MVTEPPKKTENHKENFYPTEDYPNCTHRFIKAYTYTNTKEPAAFWACDVCGRRFEPTKPMNYKSWDTPSISMPRPVPKPSQTKKPRGRKATGDSDGE